jgi:hypothetical protein
VLFGGKVPARVSGCAHHRLPPAEQEEAIVKTQKERDEERRRGKLAELEKQVQSGSLVIRKMTAEEREQNPPRPRPPRRA